MSKKKAPLVHYSTVLLETNFQHGISTLHYNTGETRVTSSTEALCFEMKRLMKSRIAEDS